MGEILAGIIAVTILFAAAYLIIGIIKLLVEMLVIEPIIDMAKLAVSIIKKVFSVMNIKKVTDI